jgi:hypothetical protein
MSRTISGALSTAERQPVVKWSHDVTARREVWSFSQLASQANADVDTAIPQSYVMRSSGALAYASWMSTTGVHRVRIIDTTVAADYALSSTSATTVAGRCMRPGLVTLANGQTWLYTADHDALGVQVRRVQLTDTTNPLSFTLADFGAIFGGSAFASFSIVQRVEAVCPTELGVIVCIGSHDFTGGLSTLTFWWLDTGGTSYELSNIIQMPLTTAYAANWGSAWYGGAEYACHVTAAAIDDRIVIVASDQVRGRAVSWTVQHGVESSVRPVAPIDPEAALLSLMPYSITAINGTLYLTARFARQSRITETTTVEAAAWDLALVSADGENWSFGELSSWLTSASLRGTLLMRADSPTVLVYAGNMRAYSSTVTQLQAPSAAQASSLNDWLRAWELHQVSDAADSLRVTLADESLSGGGSALAAVTHLVDGATIALRSGLDGTLVDVGRYVIDDSGQDIAASGFGAREITAIDRGSAQLIDYVTPIDADLRGRATYASALTDIDDLDVMTPVRGDEGDEEVRGTSTGLQYSGLNNPFVGFAGEAEDSGDVIMAATIKFTGTNTCALSSVGFVFGANREGGGNVMLLPKANAWTGYTQTKPRVRALSLKAVDPDQPQKDDTGWNMGERVNALWAAISAGAIRTEAISGAYVTEPAWTADADTEYDVVLRVFGMRVQLYVKERVTAAATIAASSAYTLVSEFLFDYRAQRSQVGRDSIGIAISTDVAGSAEWFQQAKYGDIRAQLSYASNDDSFSRLYQTGQRSTTTGTLINNIASTAALAIGMRVRLVAPVADTIATIVNVQPSSITTDVNLIVWDNGGTLVDNYYIDIYLLSVGDTSGMADSGGSRETTSGGTVVTTDQGTVKLSTISYGRAIFISEDNTAASIRAIGTDGQVHQIYSRSPSTYGAWDDTNPLPSGASGYSGSAPSAWRMVYHHGRFFDGAASAVGIPDGTSTPQYMLVGKERMRYLQVSFAKRGVYPGDAANNHTWVIMPAYYAPLPSISAGSTQLRNWRDVSGNQPGDDLGLISNAAGLLAEIVSRSNSSNADPVDAVYRVASATYISSPTTSSTSYVTLDAPYPSPIVGVATSGSAVTRQGDMLVLSGRAQDGTAKERHDADAPVLYLPRNTDESINGVTVSHLAAWSGRVVTVEDAVRRLAAQAGMRDAAFRSDHTTPTSDASLTLTTTAQSMPARASASNFVLRGRVHIGGNSTSGTGDAGVTGRKRLQIDFRSYYRLTIEQYATAADYAAGRAGNIRIGLATTSTAVTAAADGIRWLAQTPGIPVTARNLAGSVSGSSPNYTLAEDTTRLVDLMVAVQDDRVSVEINGQPLWVFDLSRIPFRSYAAGPVQISYSTIPGSYTSTWRLVELCDEITTRHTMREGGTAASAIAALTQSRHIRSRATPAGGVEWSRFWARDNAGTMGDNVLRVRSGFDGRSKRGHLKVNGATSGEYLDEAFIRNYGYRFGASDNDTASSYSLAAADAQLLAREAEEFRQPRTLEGGGFLEIQPEDQITVSTDAGGDRPTINETLAVTSARLYTTDDLRAVRGSYEARVTA